MSVQEEIKQYMDQLPEPKRRDMEALHQHLVKLFPDSKLWFLSGKDDNGKVVSNPNIGYGEQIIKYADGKTKEFYQVGISTNTLGVSVYIMGIDDKNYLPETCGKTIGKASVTGYCIKFKSLKDIHRDVLESAIRFGMSQSK